tara:strand:+ start:1338 stop:1841 length:504 start_codon:yes stop_codon:yes gene_type:complete
MTSKLTLEQKELLGAITQELRRETALAYIANGYQNKTKSYLDACESMGKKPSKNPETSASEILSYPNVLGFLRSVKEKVAQDVQIDAAWVLRQAVKVHERCMQAEPVIDKEGGSTGEYKFEHTGANKALEIIGKHIDVQAFTENVKLNAEIAVTQTLEERLTGGSKR